MGPKQTHTAMFFPTYESEIKDMTKNLKNACSPGPDGIPPAIVKATSSYISPCIKLT